MQHQLDSRFREIAVFVARLGSEPIPDDIKSYLVRFGTVLICGYVERSVEIIILSRLSTRAHPRVLEFIKSHFQRGRNLDCGAIEQLLARFDPEWYRSFSKFIEQNPDV